MTERFVYLDGKFYSRESSSPRRIARSLNAKVVSIVKFYHNICGQSELVTLHSKGKKK